MNMKDDVKSITYLKSRAADLIMQVNDTHRPVIITQNGEPRAVLQDPKSYEDLHNAIGLLKLTAQGEKDVQEGRLIAQDKVFEDLEKSLRKRESDAG